MPATEIWAERGAPELDATASVTVEEPVFEAAPETVIQSGRPMIVHEQEADVCMLTVKPAPDAGT